MTANWAGDPATWVDGELTAAQLNDLRDRFDWVKAALALHGIESASVLGPLVGARYGVRVTVSSFNVGDATDKGIAWDTETYDDDGFWASSPAATRVTIPSGGDGTYRIRARGHYSSNNTNVRQLWLLVNGTDEYGLDQRAASGGSIGTTVMAEDTIELVGGDYLQVFARQNSGSTLQLDGDLVVIREAKA